MRKLAVLSAVVAMVGGANTVSAADLSSKGVSYKDTPYEAPMAPIWGGLYVGGHVGGLWNDGGDTSKFKRLRKWWECYQSYKSDNTESQSCDKWTDWKEVEYVKFSDEDDDVTLIGGVHVGYNWQSGARVFGVEGDVSFGDGLDYLASLRARLGYAHDNLLLYVTAGVAFAGKADGVLIPIADGHDDRRVVETGEGNACGHVEQQIISCVAETSAQGRQVFNAITEASVSFDTEDPRAGLPIVTDVDAADQCDVIVFVGKLDVINFLPIRPNLLAFLFAVCLGS